LADTAVQPGDLSTVATTGSAADLVGVLGTAQLPPLAINTVNVVANQTAMLALSAQRGDMAVRQDNGRTYVLSSDSPTTLADWKEVLAAGQVQSVAGKTGVVTLAKSDVGLDAVDNTSDINKPISTATQSALDLKVNANNVTVTSAGITDATAVGKQVLTAADASTALAAIGAATSAQGAEADTALQSDDVSTVAITNSYVDLDNRPERLVCDASTGVWPTRSSTTQQTLWDSIRRSKSIGSSVIPPSGAGGAVEDDNWVTWVTS
jgi:hypothetical protein